MAKAAKITCERCEYRLTGGAPFCRQCGYPTAWASHEDRTAWEVAQYRHKSKNVPMGYAYEPARPVVTSAPATKPRGVGKLFSRRAHVPDFSAQIPAPAPGPAAPALTVVSDRAEKRVAAEKPAAHAKPRTAPSVKPARVEDSGGDTPATILAARLLNARVAELDAKVQGLQRAIEQLRAEPSSSYAR